MSAIDDRATVPISSTADFERALAQRAQGIYVLRLYVAGTTPRSARAIANLKELCEAHLKGRFELEVIDIYLHPKLMEGDQIVAAPTLLKRRPPPLRRFVGDLSDMDRVLVGLDLRSPSVDQGADGAR
jgi:circadian clock protein KaiB